MNDERTEVAQKCETQRRADLGLEGSWETNVNELTGLVKEQIAY